MVFRNHLVAQSLTYCIALFFIFSPLHDHLCPMIADVVQPLSSEEAPLVQLAMSDDRKEIYSVRIIMDIL